MTFAFALGLLVIAVIALVAAAVQLVRALRRPAEGRLVALLYALAWAVGGLACATYAHILALTARALR